MRSWARPLLRDEADLAGVAGNRLSRARGRIDPVDPAQEPRLRVAGFLEILVRPDGPLRIDGVNDVRRDNHHELGLVAAVVAGTKERAENRQIHQRRQSIDRLLALRRNQARGGDRSTRRKLDSGDIVAGAEPGDRDVANGDLRRIVDVGDFCRDPQLNAPLREDNGRKIQGHAVRLLNERGPATSSTVVAASLAGEDGDRPAGHELRALARYRRDGGLGERMRDALALKGLQRGTEGSAPPEPVQGD